MHRTLAPLVALLAWASVLVQMAFSIRNGLARGDSFLHATVDYFSYFTVTTNTLCALVLTVPWLAPESPAGKWLARPHMHAIAAGAIIVVGLAYHFLLSAINNPTGVEYVTDLGLHYLVPTLFTFHWLVAAPKEGLQFRHLPMFGLYPFAYFVWIVVRGQVMGEYPYFFVDVSDLGLLTATRNAAGILLFYFFVLATLFAVTARQRAQERA